MNTSFAEVAPWVFLAAGLSARSCVTYQVHKAFRRDILLEFELIQTQMTQKPMLRVLAEVCARALRASQNRTEDSV